MSRAEAVRSLEKLWASVREHEGDEAVDEELIRARAQRAAEVLRACQERLKPPRAGAAERAREQGWLIRSFFEDIGLGWVVKLRVRWPDAFVLLLLAFMFAVTAMPEPWSTIVMVLSGGVVLLGLIIAGLATRRPIEPARWTGAKRRWDERRCTKCSYALAGMANELDPGLLGGVEIGPRLCPECGEVWPRVPGELL